ncbi:unnamed protein product [Adineta steineri]|uniref:G-protein coupled receptors family 1 profile domain-containing protein n=1 Tax=Adineta steineri TaxID=433720 RepID=A0A814W1G0_9BILA|nr:unnamed protein product [Adineta steineri]CAF1195728.1 unnamed protein product [Adineta steineri]CAF1201409.1 unnamed protein product [Adineta steineri]
MSEQTNLSRDDSLFWSGTAPVNCDIIRIFGIYLCISSFIGIICNGSLLYSFIRYKDLRSPSNIFVMFIVGMGLLASCTLLPLTGTSSIYCQWLYNRSGCFLDGIIGFLYGCSSVYLLCAVSISRCYIIIRPLNANKVTLEKCIIASCGVVLISFLWTMMPLMGWNEYTMDLGRTSCCINWYDNRPVYLSFTIVIFIFIYCIPLIILIVTNTITMIGLKRMRENIERGLQLNFSQRRIEMERRILRSITITTCGFFITWTPYSIAVLISIFRGPDYGTPPIITSICSIFAKSSAIWIPLLYMGTSTQFRFRLVNNTAVDQQTATNRVTATQQ